MTLQGYWADLPSAALQKLPRDLVVVLPLGATEQHGPHLPLETDSIIARGICNRLIAALDQNQDIRFLPVDEITYSLEHMDFEGSQTLTYDQAIEQWIEIGTKAYQAGARKIVFLNAHGGNSPLVSIVIQELRVRYGMLAVATATIHFKE